MAATTSGRTSGYNPDNTPTKVNVGDTPLPTPNANAADRGTAKTPDAATTAAPTPGAVTDPNAADKGAAKTPDGGVGSAQTDGAAGGASGGSTGGSGGGRGGSGGSGTAAGDVSDQNAAILEAKQNLAALGGVDIDPLSHIDTAQQEEYINQYIAAAQQRQENAIDYNVNKGVTDLQRAEEDAQANFENQRKQINSDEAKALQNQALYAEARGDRGGIGAAQYAQIQATAATNRRAVNDAQTKLSTDTARQIADLRAQGEFEKADAVLQLTQERLARLMDLWQYATSTNLSIDEFNKELEKWKESFELSQAEITGYYKGQETMANLANTGWTLLQAGISPSSEQIAAMGLTAEQLAVLLSKAKKSGTRRSSGSSSSSGINLDSIHTLYPTYTQFAGSDDAGRYTIDERAEIKKSYDNA